VRQSVQQATGPTGRRCPLADVAQATADRETYPRRARWASRRRSYRPRSAHAGPW
jgi:hypothetical protein